MSYLGNTPEIYNFVAGADQFNGNGSQTVFTLSRRVTSVYDVIPVIENVIQDPFNAYTIAANTVSGTADITFTSAPLSGTGNIYVNYRATQLVSNDIVTTSQLQANSVTQTKLADNGVTAGTYGSDTKIPIVTIDSKGLIISAANVSVTIPTGYFTANAIPTMLMLSGM